MARRAHVNGPSGSARCSTQVAKRLGLAPLAPALREETGGLRRRMTVEASVVCVSGRALCGIGTQREDRARKLLSHVAAVPCRDGPVDGQFPSRCHPTPLPSPALPRRLRPHSPDPSPLPRAPCSRASCPEPPAPEPPAPEPSFLGQSAFHSSKRTYDSGPLDWCGERVGLAERAGMRQPRRWEPPRR